MRSPTSEIFEKQVDLLISLELKCTKHGKFKLNFIKLVKFKNEKGTLLEQNLYEGLNTKFGKRDKAATVVIEI